MEKEYLVCWFFREPLLAHVGVHASQPADTPEQAEKIVDSWRKRDKYHEDYIVKVFEINEGNFQPGWGPLGFRLRKELDPHYTG